jgi:MFS family permease
VTSVPLRRNRDFVLLQAGQLLSAVGSQAASIAYPLLVLALTHSAVRAGLVAFFHALPLAVLAIPAGLAADRWNRRTVMIVADAARALAVTGLVVALVTHHAAYWVIALVAAVEGTGSTFFAAASPGALRSVVPHEQLPEAMAAQTGRQAAVLMAGPPAGGGLFEIARQLPFVADALSYVFSTASLLCMRAPFQEVRPADTSTLRARVREGMSFIWHHPFIRATTFLYAFLNFNGSGLLFCLVVIARGQGRSGAAIGVLVALFAVAAFVGSFLTSRVRRALSSRAVMLLESWCWLGCAAFLLWPSAYVLAAGLIPVGLAFPTTDSVVHAYRLVVTPDRLLGRAESVRSAMAQMLASVAPLVAGLLLAHATPRWTIAGFTLSGVLVVVFGLRSDAIASAPGLEDVERPS